MMTRLVPNARARRWLAPFALVLFGLLFGVLMAEAGLRVFGFERPVFSQPDNYRGWSLRPHASGRSVGEGGAFVQINGQGLRDREHQKRKPAGTYRIAVLGDSFAEAEQVAVQETFWSVLESVLNQDDTLEKDVEVINFGVSGYGTTQQLLTLRCCVWDYSPDLVLLAFFAANDIIDNSPTLDTSSTRFARPYFVLTDGKLEPTFPFRTSLRFQLSRILAPLFYYSRTLQLGLKAHHTIVRRRAPITVDTTLTETLVEYEKGMEPAIYREPENEALREAWHITESLLLLIHQETLNKGADFAMVTLSHSAQVHPDASIRQQFMQRMKIEDLFYPDARIKDLGNDAGFRTLNLAPILLEHVESQHVYLHGFENRKLGIGHWNEAGHQLAGNLVADWLIEEVVQGKYAGESRRDYGP